MRLRLTGRFSKFYAHDVLALLRGSLGSIDRAPAERFLPSQRDLENPIGKVRRQPQSVLRLECVRQRRPFRRL